MKYFNNKYYEHYKSIIQRERLPLAFVDLERFDDNIAYVASTQAETGKTIRIGTKSIRCIDLIRRIFQWGGPVYKGILAFTMEEAEFLVKNGFDDIIVAYPTVQKSDIRIFLALVRSKKEIRLMIDSEEHLKILNEAGKQYRTMLSACMEVDMAYRPLGLPIHLGIRRSPVRTLEQALKLARLSKRYKWVSIDALMGYEGHVASTNDNVPGQWFKNRVMRRVKNASIREFTPRRDNIVEALREEGLDIKIVNGGGSGSLVSSGRDPLLTEVVAGSAFFCPGLFHHFKDVAFKPSAFFAVQIVRKPAKSMVTCLGGGYTASGAAGPDKLPYPVMPVGLKMLSLEGAGEVQTPLKLPRDCPELNLGDPVFFQHAKGGELCERFDELYLVEGNRITRRVKTYRGHGRAFL